MKKTYLFFAAAVISALLTSCSSGGSKTEGKTADSTQSAESANPANSIPMTLASNDTVGFTIMLPEGAKMLPVNKGGANGDIYSCNIFIKAGDMSLNPIVMHYDNMLVGSLDDVAKMMYGKTIKEKKAIGSDYLVLSNPDSTKMQSISYYAKGPKDYLCFSGEFPASEEAMFVKIASSLKAK